jgi:hypothetical protein
MRRLLSTRRRVPLDLVDDYLLAWARLRVLAERNEAHAWIFRGSEHDDQFIEFIEWDDSKSDPLLDDGVNAARTALDAFAHAISSDEWEETG